MTGGALLAGTTVLLAACTGSPATSAAPGTTPGSSAPASAPVSSAPSPPATPSTSAPANSTPPATPSVSVAGSWSGTGSKCPDLTVKLGLGQGTTNTTYQVIDFTNHGPVACILDGYPGINLAGGTPVAPIGLPAAHTQFRAAKPVTLHPGEVGNALVQITDAHTYSAARCGPVKAQYLIVYRPNLAVPLRLAYATTACSQPVQMLQVSSISLGTGD